MKHLVKLMMSIINITSVITSKTLTLGDDRVREENLITMMIQHLQQNIKHQILYTFDIKLIIHEIQPFILIFFEDNRICVDIKSSLANG